MCIDVEFELGIVLGTCHGVVIPDDAYVWRESPEQFKWWLEQAKVSLRYLREVEALRCYRMNDGGRMQKPPRDMMIPLLKAADNILHNPWATKDDKELANILKPRLERWLNPTAFTDKSQQKQSKEGWVYLLAGNGYYKIGQTNDVKRRIGQISPKLPFEVEILCAIPTNNAHKLEADLHNLYNEKRTNGEWFELNEADVEYIRRLADE